MTVFPARRAVPLAPRRALPPARSEPTNAPNALAAVRPRPMDWARKRRAEREARRIEAAGARAINQLDHLGPAWHVVEWPRTDAADGWFDADAGVAHERAGFLAIGPSGLFAVTIADHGRSRVMLAGDVVQINGKRPGVRRRGAPRRQARRQGAVQRRRPERAGHAGAHVRRFGRHQRLRPAEGLPRGDPPRARPSAHRGRPPDQHGHGRKAVRGSRGTHRPGLDNGAERLPVVRRGHNRRRQGSHPPLAPSRHAPSPCRSVACTGTKRCNRPTGGSSPAVVSG